MVAAAATEVLMGTRNDSMVHGSFATMARMLLAAAVCVGATAVARADEGNAKKLLKGMTDYMTAQKSISFDYDAGLEVVTKDDQKLALLSSGNVVLNRPDKIRSPAPADLLTSKCCSTERPSRCSARTRTSTFRPMLPVPLINSSTSCRRSSSGRCLPRTCCCRMPMTN